MRYCFICQTLSQGGAERVISVLASALSKIGSDVTIVKYFDTNGEYIVNEKVRIVNLSGGDYTIYSTKNICQLIIALRKQIKAIKPDYIIPFTLPVAQLTAIATIGLPVNVFQSIRINPQIMPKKKWKRMIRDWLVYHSKCTFVQTVEQKKYFRSKYHNKIHVLSNPVSEDLFDSIPKIPDDEFIICAVGRLTDQKNFKLLIDSFVAAFSDCASVKLRIYGEGLKKEFLQQYIEEKKMKSRIELKGRSNDIKSVFQESDIYVLSSDWEGMPNALIEAMACHTFCISTDCPTGPSDLIQNGENGVLVPVKDVQAMKEALLYAFHMPYEERNLMSGKGRETIKQKCSSLCIAKKMDEICQSAVK